MSKRKLGRMLIASEGPAVIDESDRFKHLYILGRSGMGKTVFALNLARQDFDNCCIILDAGGTLSQKAADLAPVERLIFIDKSRPIVLNPLNRPGLHWSEIANEFAEIVNSAVEGTTSTLQTTVLMKTLISNAVRVLNPVPGNRNIKAMSDLLDSHKVRQKMFDKEPFVNGKPNPRYDEYWSTFDDLEPLVRQFANAEKRQSAKRVATRLAEFCYNPVLSKFVLNKDEFNVEKFVKEKKIVIFDLSGFDDDTKVYLANLAIAAVKSYYNHKPSEGGDPLYLYCDEFHRFAYPYWEQFLTQSRKHNIAVTLAHQIHKQISEKELNAALGSVENYAVFSCGPLEAKNMGELYDIKPEILKNLKKYQAYIRVGNKNHLVSTYPPPEPPKREDRSFLQEGWITP